MGLKLLGTYGMEAPLAKLPKCLGDVVQMGFDGCSVIGRLANKWICPPDPTTFNLQWKYLNGRWILEEENDAYFDEFEGFLNEFASHHLALFYKFQSTYYKTSWNKFPAMKCKQHPFVNNNAGISMDGDPRQLYDSITFGPLKYHWMKWKDISEPKNQFDFAPNNKLGVAMMSAYRRMIKIIAKVKKANPNWIFGYAPNNEEVAGKLGDRSEIHAWFHDEFKKVGMDTNVNGFYRVVNRQGDAAETKQIHIDCGKKWGMSYGLGALHEVHIDGVNDPTLIGLNKSRTLASADGMPVDGNFVKNNQDLMKAGYVIADGKYEEAINGNIPVAPFKWMVNWLRCAKDHGAFLQ